MTLPTYLQKLNPPQLEAAQHVDGPLLILAGAGSGKTRVIISRLAHLIAQGIKPWNILSVTFTNKAASEMRNRVDALVGARGRGSWTSTFHSFCAQFIRVEAKVLGLDSNFVIYDNSDQLSVVKSILKEMRLTEKQFPPSQIINIISRAKDELIDYAIRSGAPLEVIENLQELEDESDTYESIEDIWPDYPTHEDFFFDEEEH